MKKAIFKVFGPLSDIPYYWRNETNGRLETAVMRYINQEELVDEDFDYLQAYFQQWINARCFDGQPAIAELRESIETINNLEDINSWLDRALVIGIDPL